MGDITGINTHLTLTICDDAQDAIDKGFDYNKWEKAPTPLNIETAVVVRKGMQSGAATYDLLLVDSNGNKFVTLISAGLMKTMVRVGEP